MFKSGIIYDTYSGYRIARTPAFVSFGCGAVTVKKTDLRALARIVQDKKFVANFTKVGRVGNKSLNSFVGKPAQAAAFFKFAAKYRNEINVLERLDKATGRRRSVSQLLKIQPETLLQIAGK